MSEFLYRSSAGGGGSSGAAGNASIARAFNNIAIPANDNVGLSSTPDTNPYDLFFANDAMPAYGPQTVFVKNAYLIDSAYWKNETPTYELEFHGNPHKLKAFVTSSRGFLYQLLPGAQTWYFNQYKHFTGNSDSPLPFWSADVSFVGRNAGFLYQPINGNPTKFTITRDGGESFFPPATTGIIGTANLNNNQVQKYLPYFGLSQAAFGIHTVNLSVQGQTDSPERQFGINGSILEHTGFSDPIAFYPGSFNRNGLEIAVPGATIAAPLTSPGNSFGFRSVFYVAGNGITYLSIGASSFMSNGTVPGAGATVLTLNIGDGPNFKLGDGLLLDNGAGATPFYNSVVSVAGDDVTLRNAVPYSGVTFTVYRLWETGASGPASAYQGQLRWMDTINWGKDEQFATCAFFGPTLQVQQHFWDPQMRWAVSFTGMALENDLITNGNGNTFLSYDLTGNKIRLRGGASAFIQVEGRFQALALSRSQNQSSAPGFSANIEVNGILCNDALFVGEKTVVVKNLPFQWNIIRLYGEGPFGEISMYEQGWSNGITAPIAYIDTLAPFRELGTTATVNRLHMGVHQRLAAAQVPNVFGVGDNPIGGNAFFGKGSSTIVTTFWGNRFSGTGETAFSRVPFVDGASFATILPGGVASTLLSEGYHRLDYGAGASNLVSSLEFYRTFDELKFIPSQQPVKGLTEAPKVAVYPEWWISFWGRATAPVNALFGWTTLETYTCPHVFGYTNAGNNSIEIIARRTGFYSVVDWDTGAASPTWESIFTKIAAGNGSSQGLGASLWFGVGSRAAAGVVTGHHANVFLKAGERIGVARTGISASIQPAAATQPDLYSRFQVRFLGDTRNE
jgi:hypothetical protein